MLRDRGQTRATVGGLAALLAIGTVGTVGCSTFQQEESNEPGVITETEQRPTGDVQGDLPEGAELTVRLDRPLSSESSRAGDPWRAALTHDVTDGSRVLLGRGAIVSGVVTRAGEVEVEGKTRQVIALEPQTLHLSDGDHLPIEAEVVDAEVERKSNRSTEENIAIIGGSTVAGALLGDILFDEALLGAILGGAGGTVVAIATAETEIELAEGSALTLRLQDRVRVAGATRDR